MRSRLLTTLLLLSCLRVSAQLADGTTRDVRHGVERATDRADTAAGRGRHTAPSGFEENKGQVISTTGDPAPDVKFRLTQGHTSIFLLESGIAYQFNRTHTPAGGEEALPHAPGKTCRETFRMDMSLERADPHARITTAGRSNDYTHYYNHDALDVRTFREVTYHDVYPGIDWVIRTDDKGIAYDFVVKPHADPGLIRMRFTGHERLYVNDDGRLVHGNRLGQFTEEKPICHQRTASLPARFVLDGSLLTFAMADYDKEDTLVIDPPRAWATYFGGSELDGINAIAADADRNVYIAGTTRSDNGIASLGNDTVFNTFNDNDAMLVKFNSYGTRLWGIYYGGVFSDEFAALTVDASGYVFCAGSTMDQYLATCDTHQGSLSGEPNVQADALLVKFRPDGTRIWGTYYGGAGDDRGYSCAVDQAGHVFLAGETNTANGNAIANSGHQNIYGSGPHDAFLAKFNANGTRQWGTYYGGLADDGARDCATDPSGNVYLTGYTRSANGIAALGAHQSANAGSVDGFLVKFNPYGTRLWGTYYGGSLLDSSYSCAADGSGNAFIIGMTKSASGIAVSGAHQPERSGNSDAFVAKFDPTGTRLWGTYYGGLSGESGRDCAAGPDGNITFCGTTESPQAIAWQGFQDTLAGAPSDAFLARLTPDGERVFGTYYGSVVADQGLACGLAPYDGIYLAGATNSPYGIAADGTFAPAHQFDYGSTFDGFLVKFGVDLNCLGTMDSLPFPGDACDDGDACTDLDVYNLACTCTGTMQFDDDGDGVCNTIDTICPNGPNPGMLCEDNDPNTVYSYVDAACTCIGVYHCQIVGDCPDAACARNECLCGSCVQTPYAIGAIAGDTWVTGPSGNTYTISANADVASYAWQLPPGWSSSDTTSPLLSATAGSEPGTFALCVTVVFEGCPAPVDTCIDVTVTMVGIQDQRDLPGAGFSVQPNPSEGLFNVTRFGSATMAERLMLVDATGRQVLASGFAMGQQVATLDLHHLAPGMYLLHVARETRARPVKLIIKR